MSVKGILVEIKRLFIKPKPLPKNMMLKSRDMGNGKFEVCGVVFYADSHTEALRKYKRAKGLL